MQTDKASMLDEIIDYVKFLQLQVKVCSSPLLHAVWVAVTCLLISSLWLQVLSMSRLGATEAVVPLLTESQTEVNHASLKL